MIMFKTREQKQKLKNILIAMSIFLSAMFAVIIIYGAFSARPKSMDKAAKLGQYYEFESEALPSSMNQVSDNLDFSKRKVFLGDQSQDDKVIDTETESDVKNQAPQSSLEGNKISKPTIAIFVSNLGLNKIATDLALSLPRQVSLGFLPYIDDIKSAATKATENGHEVFMYLPFETQKYPDDFPGKLPLLISLSDEENIKRMNELLHSFAGYVGIYGAPNEVFTDNYDRLGAILTEMASKKLTLLVSNGKKDYSGEMANKILYADVIIDKEPNVPAIKKQLDHMVELAKSGKKVIGYAGSYPVTIYTLKAWIANLEEMGVELIPVTGFIQNNKLKFQETFQGASQRTFQGSNEATTKEGM